MPARTGLYLCGSLTRTWAGLGVGVGPRGTPITTQLLHVDGGDPQLGGLPPPTDRARWVATGRTGLDMCGVTTRERARARVRAGPRGTPVITQLFHLVGVTPQLGGPVLPTGQAQGVATRHTGLGMCRSLTRAGAGAEVGAGPRADPVITQLLPRGGGDPPMGWPAPAHRQGSVGSHCTCRARRVWRHHTRGGRRQGGGRPAGCPRHSATSTSDRG